jgi:hypothetical protein
MASAGAVSCARRGAIGLDRGKPCRIVSTNPRPQGRAPTRPFRLQRTRAPGPRLVVW